MPSDPTPPELAPDDPTSPPSTSVPSPPPAPVVGSPPPHLAGTDTPAPELPDVSPAPSLHQPAATPPGDGPGAGGAVGDDVAPHRLPAVSMLSGINPRSLLSALPALFIAGNAFEQFLLVAAAVVAILVGIARVVHWSRFRWGFDGQVLHVHSGLVWRSRRAVDIARMQQVELERPLLHRVLGTALVRVETAADAGEAEVALNGLDVETATALRGAISAARRRATQPATSSSDAVTVDAAAAQAPTPPTVELFRPSVADLVRHAVTGRTLLVLPAGLAALAQFGWEIFDDDLDQVAGSAAETASALGIAVLVIAFLVVGVGVAIGTTLLRDWDLVLAREGDDLRLSRGLLDQRSATVPMQRLQVVDYRQNWLRRRLGVGTLNLRSAGGGGSDEDRRITIPWVPRELTSRLLSVALNGVVEDDDALPTEGRRHPPAARRRLWFAWLRAAAMPILGLTATALGLLDGRRGLVLVVASVVAIIAIAATGGLSGAQYRRLGHETTDRVLLVTGGVLGHTSTWMPLARMQGVEARANPFQRRLDLVTIVVSPAGGGNQPVDIPDVSAARATELGRDFVAVAAGRVIPVDPVGLTGTLPASPA